MIPGPVQEEIIRNENPDAEMTDAEICVCLPIYIIGTILVVVYFTVGF